ncbi:MAG: hypothetical protein V4484_03725 [Pseudomonadota bacterium]
MKKNTIVLLIAGLCASASQAQVASAPPGGRPAPIKIVPIQTEATQASTGGRPAPIRIVPGQTNVPVASTGGRPAPIRYSPYQPQVSPAGAGGRPPPSRNAPVKTVQTAAQAGAWMHLMADLKPKPLAAGLFVLGTSHTPTPGTFPAGAGTNYIYAAPQLPVHFLLRLDGPGGAKKFVLQVATESTTQNLVAPYAGWSKPNGMVWSQELKAAVKTQPDSPADKAFNNVMAPLSGQSALKMSDSAKYVYFDTPLPVAELAKPGTNLYLRIVTLSGHETAPTPVAPASNWVHFYVDISQAEQEKIIADNNALAAKQAADKLAAAAKAEATKKKEALQAQLLNAQQAIAAAYEIRLLSYIPPKFSDDTDAPLYFIAKREVDVPYDGGTTRLSSGQTYYLTQVKNMLNSTKTWNQDLWDLASATLNMVSSGYEAAKGFAVDTVASGFDVVPGVSCGATCKGALKTSLNLALAACGVPPSIPNINEVYNHGLDYMAATLADVAIEQITGVAVGELGAGVDSAQAAALAAREPAKKGLHALLDKISRPAAFEPDVPETWGTPAPFFRHHPAMLYLEIRRKPGSALPTGQSWQSMALTFNGDFENIPTILLPRTMDDKVRIPVALATIDGPSSWTAKGVMPDFNVDPWAGVGQPYYGDRGSATIGIWTTHRMAGTGAMFNVPWPAIGITTGYVNAIALPNKQSVLPSEQDKALQSGSVVQGPDNYFGKTRLRWFTP